MDDSSGIPPCPYPGMIPFSEYQSDLFFGRADEISAAVALLCTNRFLAVIGPSGSGKSSLVFAGILPAMKQLPELEQEELQVRVMRPGPAPLAALAGAMGGASDATPDDIVTVATQIAANAPQLVILDQFHEAFSIARADQSKAFLDAVARMIGIPNLYLILTVRADFYADLMISPLWAEIRDHRLEITAPYGNELRTAIVRPAESAGFVVEPALVERLVADASVEPNSLPFVQETLALLWETASNHHLTLAAYERMAADATTVSGLRVAMAQRAEATYCELPPESQRIARRAVLRLVQYGEGQPDTRRQQTLAELRSVADDPAVFDATLRRLVERRLLVMDIHPENAVPTVSMAHEALISGWPRLREWIELHRESERMRRRLEAKAQEWVRLGRGDGGLLDAVELAEVELWLKQDEFGEAGLTATTASFVNQSRRRAGTPTKALREALK